MRSVVQAELSIEKETQVSVEPQENIKRSLIKTISWRVVGTLATVIISYLITGTLALAFSIGGIELISKMVLYFFHERAWNNIKWGK
ncbi:putative membrane protein [Winogradskyella eximia]|jgi:uncharacterized membrane protein|uniref:Putative membrane protein n=1 Tax=Winogradskyella eximia TaxID=262006 RepID=A0A3D9H147_9FLAO|nr:DUF2061 domain-containing protein [Winogradskyella eximia]RED43223.1 putative membrane protein [Winogradskyella eximia]|tara:strand:+ start:397 stop:657 length:261 start_codon:yes stop_codon:yes gene_type:complete